MKKHQIGSLTQNGAWTNNYRRYYGYARELAGELTELIDELAKQRPPDAPPHLCESERTPEAVRQYGRRDRCADGIRIYSAMAIEAFLNLYGVIRLGDGVYTRHLERCGLERKTETLLLFCDNCLLDDNDELVNVIQRIAKSRNALVHPKAHRLDSPKGQAAAKGDPIPEAAMCAWGDCQRFFELFVQLVPETKRFVAHLEDAG